MKITQWLKFSKILVKAKLKTKEAQPLDFAGRYAIIHDICKDFYKDLKLETEFTGVENIPSDEAVYYISNHQGTFDPLLLIAANPNPMTFISKKENLKLPVIADWGKLIEFITFDRDDFDQNVSMLRQATRFLKSNKSVLVFPEGTRAKGQDLLPFKSGAVLPAFLAKSKIVCVTQNFGFECDGTSPVKHTLSVHFHPPLLPEDFRQKSHDEVMNECVKIIESKLKSA